MTRRAARAGARAAGGEAVNETPQPSKEAGELPADVAMTWTGGKAVRGLRVGERIMYRGQLCEVMARRENGTYVVTPVLEAARLQAAQRRPRNRHERRAAASRKRRA